MNFLLASAPEQLPWEVVADYLEITSDMGRGIIQNGIPLIFAALVGFVFIRVGKRFIDNF